VGHPDAGVLRLEAFFCRHFNLLDALLLGIVLGICLVRTGCRAGRIPVPFPKAFPTQFNCIKEN
jgi:hypothetical protein